MVRAVLGLGRPFAGPGFIHGQTLVVSLVLSRLDYGNSVLVGLPAYLVCRLQSVLNASARLVFNLRRYDSVTDTLANLHWLRVPQRVEYKIAVLTYKALNGTGPRYLGPLVRVADLPGRQSLHQPSRGATCQTRHGRQPIVLGSRTSRLEQFAGPCYCSCDAGDISPTAQNSLV